MRPKVCNSNNKHTSSQRILWQRESKGARFYIFIKGMKCQKKIFFYIWRAQCIMIHVANFQYYLYDFFRVWFKKGLGHIARVQHVPLELNSIFPLKLNGVKKWRLCVRFFDLKSAIHFIYIFSQKNSNLYNGSISIDAVSYYIVRGDQLSNCALFLQIRISYESINVCLFAAIRNHRTNCSSCNVI